MEIHILFPKKTGKECLSHILELITCTLRSKRIIKVQRRISDQLSHYYAPHDYNHLDQQYNELSILLGNFALCVFGTSDRQYVPIHYTLDITAKAHAFLTLIFHMSGFFEFINSLNHTEQDMKGVTQTSLTNLQNNFSLTMMNIMRKRWIENTGL